MRNRKKERIKKFYRGAVLALLIFITLGFMVPSFITPHGSNQNANQAAEPRFCQTDSDCYLTCDNAPQAVLCTQNLCTQNSCEEFPSFPYIENPSTFELVFDLPDQEIVLASQARAENFFITASGSEVNVHTFGTTIAQVVEKFGASFTHSCMLLNGQSYCLDQGNLTVSADGQVTDFAHYPIEGEQIIIQFEEY